MFISSLFLHKFLARSVCHRTLLNLPFTWAEQHGSDSLHSECNSAALLLHPDLQDRPWFHQNYRGEEEDGGKAVKTSVTSDILTVWPRCVLCFRTWWCWLRRAFWIQGYFAPLVWWEWLHKDLFNANLWLLMRWWCCRWGSRWGPTTVSAVTPAWPNRTTTLCGSTTVSVWHSYVLFHVTCTNARRFFIWVKMQMIDVIRESENQEVCSNPQNTNGG